MLPEDRVEQLASYDELYNILKQRVRPGPKAQQKVPRALVQAIALLRHLFPRGATSRPKAKYRNQLPARDRRL